MAELTAALVKALRERTDAGMMDCKKALVACNCDMEAAVKFLREKGIAKAAAKAGREAKEGVVRAVVSPCGCDGILFELNCETDFCAKGEKVQGLVDEVGKALAASKAATLEEALQVPMGEGTVEEGIKAMCVVIGENMGLRRFARFTVEGTGTVASYIHMGGKIGVIVDIATGKKETLETEAFKALALNLCLQVTASAPQSLCPDELDKKFIEEEQAIAKKQLIEQGKPEALLEKILPGKLRALYAQVCLLNQPTFNDDKVSVQQTIDRVAKEVGDTIAVKKFARFQLGA